MHDALADTRSRLADLLVQAGLPEGAEALSGAGVAELPRVARAIAADLHERQRGRLAYAFAALELAARHAGQPGLEDIAARNLRSARRFAGLDEALAVS